MVSVFAITSGTLCWSEGDLQTREAAADNAALATRQPKNLSYHPHRSVGHWLPPPAASGPMQ